MKTPSFNFDFTNRNHADDVIDALVERVLAAYPPERIARIKSRTAWTWNSAEANGKTYDDRVSYLVTTCGGPYLSDDIKNPPDATPIQSEMILQLRTMLDYSVVDDEYFPGFSSGLQQVTIPSLFGCVKESVSDSDHIKPVVQTPSDVFNLPPPEIREGHACHDMLWKMAYKHQRAGGRIPVYMTDIQGPFSCAAQMWGIQDFLCGLRAHEKETRHLLSLCTDAIIGYFHAMYTAVDGDLVPIHCMPVLWVPRDCGVAVSDDFFAVVGAADVEEFSVPYLERIGEAFGGLTAHTCGNMNHLATVMNKMKTLRALNFSATETDLARYARACDPRITILAHHSGASCAGLPLLSTSEHIRQCAKAQRETGVKIFAKSLWVPDTADAARCKEWADAARLHSVST